MAVVVVPGLYAVITNTEVAPRRYKVTALYSGWRAPSASEYQSLAKNIATIDEVSPYWYALKADGSVATYDWAEDPRLIALAHDNGKPLVPLITNEFDGGRVGRMLATSASRKAHAEELTNLMVSKGYAGLYLDYEMLHTEDRAEFTVFVEYLASRLHRKGKKLCIAVHPKTAEPGTWDGPKAQNWKSLGRAVDEFTVMTYDYHWDGSTAGPASPPEWVDKVLTFAKTQVAPHKIRMGLPFYGRDWQGTRAEDLVSTEVYDLIDRHSPEVRRDPSGEPYFEYPGGHTVYYQDYRSIDMKLNVLVEKHPRVGGIAIWHVGGEFQPYWTAIKGKLKR